MKLRRIRDIADCESNDLAELALVAGYDPKTFYRDTVLRDGDVSDLDLRGMQFKAIDLSSIKFNLRTKFDRKLHVDAYASSQAYRLEYSSVRREYKSVYAMASSVTIANSVNSPVRLFERVASVLPKLRKFALLKEADILLRTVEIEYGEDIQFQTLYAQHLLEIGEYDQAESRIREQIKKHPSNAVLLDFLSLIYLHQRLFDKAADINDKAIKMYPNVERYHKKAMIFFLTNQNYRIDELINEINNKDMLQALAERLDNQDLLQVSPRFKKFARDMRIKSGGYEQADLFSNQKL